MPNEKKNLFLDKLSWKFGCIEIFKSFLPAPYLLLLHYKEAGFAIWVSLVSLNFHESNGNYQ